ncbi:MAG: FAD-binding oxidoreductase [Sedimentitalea sp.]|uniref:FAD-binding oxidoreductase n=1 Tax=Sedimentitalea sp. TaxID=2048915 RepID=UPI003267F3EB
MSLDSKLSQLLGTLGWLTGPDDTAPYVRDWLDRYGVQPIGVARPANTQEVSDVIRVCSEAGTIVVPQGGGTGLVGGSVASNPNSVILSLSRMAKIEEIDESDFTVIVEAGVVLARLHEQLQAQNLAFPLHLGSEGSAQIGGLIATNAGGSHAFRYGCMMDLVLGLEVVLPNGEIWNGMRRLIKDNSGFQLRKLFCGSEGRLGVVTRAALRLYPAPRSRATALIAVPDINAMMVAGNALRRSCGEMLVAMEFFDDAILDLSLSKIPDLSWPMESRAAYYLLVELSTSIASLNLDTVLENLLEPVFEDGLAIDAIVAQSEAQRAALWRIREELPEGTLREGRQIKHDIAVPISQIPAFLADCAPKVQAVLNGTRIWTFGHLADGNIHYNLSPPRETTDFADLDAEISAVIYATAESHGGTFAAEHGVGRSKRAIAETLRSPVERHLMVQVQKSLDSRNLMNEGVITSSANTNMASRL